MGVVEQETVQEWQMSKPPSAEYHDVNADSPVCELKLDTINNFLAEMDKALEKEHT